MVDDPRRHTFVLVHGGFHGGWCWREVARHLASRGHEVHSPTQTGLGERAHLLDGSVGLKTFISDIVGVLDAEELSDVVLVGHSLGAASVTGAADRRAHLLAQIVFLDGLLVPHGRCVFDDMAAADRERREPAARDHCGGIALRPFPASAFGVTDPEQVSWLQRRLTPHPLRTFWDRMDLTHPFGNGVPCTYVVCTDPLYPAAEPSRRWVREQHPEWQWREIATGHDAMVLAPELVAAELHELAGGRGRPRSLGRQYS